MQSVVGVADLRKSERKLVLPLKVEMPHTQPNLRSCCQERHEGTVNEKLNVDGKSLVEDILTNGDKYYIDETPKFLPTWYSHDLVISGQEYFHKNIFNMFVAKLTGLLILLSSPTIVHILHETGKSSEPVRAYKRYMATIMLMLSWYKSDLKNPDSKGRQAINTVRNLHFAASKSSGPITQKDMALAQFGFIGIALISTKKLGLKGDQTGLIHFWRVIGYLLGVHDRFNLCQGNTISTITACEELAKRYFIPQLENPPVHFKKMSEALLEGIWPLILLFNPEAFVEHSRRICGCSPKKLPFIPLMFLYLQIFVHKLLQMKIISMILLPFLNFLMSFSIYAQIKIPIVAFMTFNDVYRTK